jgi:hypothetical protein
MDTSTNVDVADMYGKIVTKNRQTILWIQSELHCHWKIITVNTYKRKINLKIENLLYQSRSNNGWAGWKWISLKSKTEIWNSAGKNKAKGFDDYKKQWT